MFCLPRVSVVIPTYRDWHRLIICLEALQKQTLNRDFFEIIIVNNDPSDCVPDHFSALENVILLTQNKPGSYAARNMGVRAARGDIIAFTDSDCQPREDWLEKAIECLDANTGVDRVAGRVDLLFSSPERLTICEIYEKVFAFRQQEYVVEQGMAATANLLVRRSVFTLTGLFDEGLMSGGDAEWGTRASALGSKMVYCSRSVVMHPTRNSLEGLMQKARREAGGHLLLRTNRSPMQALSVFFLGILPPIRSIKRVMMDETLTPSEKVVALTMRYFLRVISYIEQLKLILLLKKPERT